MAASGFSTVVLVAADDGAQEAFDEVALLPHAGLAGDEDELVVGGHAVVLDVEHVDGVAQHLALDGLDVPVGADRCVDFSGVQRRPQVEADIDKLHGVESSLDAGAAQDRLQVDLVAGDAGVADALAGELGGIGDPRTLEGLNRVERDVDDGADGGDGDALRLGQDHVGLVADGEVDGVPGDELGRGLRGCRRKSTRRPALRPRRSPGPGPRRAPRGRRWGTSRGRPRTGRGRPPRRRR